MSKYIEGFDEKVRLALRCRPKLKNIKISIPQHWTQINVVPRLYASCDISLCPNIESVQLEFLGYQIPIHGIKGIPKPQAMTGLICSGKFLETFCLCEIQCVTYDSEELDEVDVYGMY